MAHISQEEAKKADITNIYHLINHVNKLRELNQSANTQQRQQLINQLNQLTTTYPDKTKAKNPSDANVADADKLNCDVIEKVLEANNAINAKDSHCLYFDNLVVGIYPSADKINQFIKKTGYAYVMSTKNGSDVDFMDQNTFDDVISKVLSGLYTHKNYISPDDPSKFKLTAQDLKHK